MINNRDKKIYGGLLFGRDAIDSYFESELWTGFEGDENTDVYMKDIYAVANFCYFQWGSSFVNNLHHFLFEISTE